MIQDHQMKHLLRNAPISDCFVMQPEQISLECRSTYKNAIKKLNADLESCGVVFAVGWSVVGAGVLQLCHDVALHTGLFPIRSQAGRRRTEQNVVFHCEHECRLGIVPLVLKTLGNGIACVLWET